VKLLFENWRNYTKTLSKDSLSIGMGGQYPPEEDPSKEEATEDWSQTTPEEAAAGMSLDPERPPGPDVPVTTPEKVTAAPVDKMDIKQLKRKHRENAAAMKKAVADTEGVEKWSQLPKDHEARLNFRETYTQLRKLNWGR
jgi:hypothetical protein